MTRAAPITVHGCMTPNVAKVLILLEEIGVAYDVAFVNVIAGEQFSEPFAAINPNAKLPAITVRDDPAGTEWTLAESLAILWYLADRSGRFLPTGRRERAVVRQWMLVQATGLGPALGQARHFSGLAPQPQDYAVGRFRSEAIRLFQVFERRLGASEWLGGDSYGIADMNLFPWIRDVRRYRDSGADFGLSDGAYPALDRWFDQIAARPAVQAAIAAMGPLETATRAAMAQATPDDFDRLFGRGRWQRS